MRDAGHTPDSVRVTYLCAFVVGICLQLSLGSRPTGGS